MRLRNVLLIFLLAVLVACKRETFQPAKEPMSLRVINPSKPIDLVAEPLKEQMISWDGKSIPELKIEGILNIEYRDEYYQYLQLKCPAELKCNGSNAFAPVSLAMELHPDGKIAPMYSKEHRKKRPFLIVPSNQSEKIDSLMSWLKNPANSQVPEMFDEQLLNATVNFFLDSLPAPEQEGRIAGWYYLGQAMREGDYDPNFEPFLKRFKELDRIAHIDARLEDIRKAHEEDRSLPGELTLPQAQFLQAFRELVSPKFLDSLDSYYYDFPFLAKTNSGLASAMNNQNLPVYKERVVKDLLQEASYTAISRRIIPAQSNQMLNENPAPSEIEKPMGTESSDSDLGEATTQSNGTSEPGENRKPKLEVTSKEFSKGSGLSIQVSTDPIVQLTSIRAKPHKKGLNLVVLGVAKDSGNKYEYELEPGKESSYLLAARSSTVQKFKAMSDDEIMEKPDYAHRLFLAVLKYGQGKYEKKERKFQYVVQMDQPAYWKILTIIKSNQAINVHDESTYSGPLEMAESESRLRWAQHYDKDLNLSQLKLHGYFHMCERGCWDETIEVSCLDNTEDSFLILEFPAKALTQESFQKEDIEALLVHKKLSTNETYYMDQLCTQALGIPVQEEFTDWIAGLPQGHSNVAAR